MNEILKALIPEKEAEELFDTERSSRLETAAC